MPAPRIETVDGELLDDDPDESSPRPELSAAVRAQAARSAVIATRTRIPTPVPTAGPDDSGNSHRVVPIGEFGSDGATTIDSDLQHSGVNRAPWLGGESQLTEVTPSPLVESSRHRRGSEGELTHAGEGDRPSEVDLTTPHANDRSRRGGVGFGKLVPGDRSDVTNPDAGGRADTNVEGSDPTLGSDGSERGVYSPLSPQARLRAGAALRRKRGLYGDIVYVATALFGVRRASRELDQLEARQAQLQASRKRHLTTLGRAAVSADDFEHPALERAREQLSEIEDERSQHTAQVQAADSELLRVRSDRAEAATRYQRACATLEAELTDLARKLEPLEKEVAAAAKRAADLRGQIARITKQIGDADASLVSVRGEKLDRASVKADIATAKADLIAVKRDEPEIASRLDVLNPRIAALDARRTETQQQRKDQDEAELRDQKRTEELLAAIGAKRVVVDRAAKDAEVLRDKILLALGEQLYVDRPDDLRYELAPVDAIDMELGTMGRRIMELREILGSVDRWKLFRGIGVIVLAVGAVAAFSIWLCYAL